MQSGSNFVSNEGTIIATPKAGKAFIYLNKDEHKNSMTINIK